ncbi:MAG: tetratricopeptide repeat protein [Terricaulis sp.]
MSYVRTLGRLTAGVAVLAGVMPVTAAFAQPTLDRVLSDATVEEGAHCAVVQVGFNFPVRYVSHFPSAAGDEVRVRVRAFDQREHGAAMARRESVRAPDSALANITAIDFDGNRPEGATLSLLFDGATRFAVGQGGDFRSINIAINDGTDPAQCTPTSHPGDEAIIAVPSREPERVSTEVDNGVGAGDPLLAEARAAMTAGDNAHAVQLLTRILETPTAPSARDAQELLGLARERAGQSAHARAEYEEYIHRYPSGAPTERVRQRLAGVLAAEVPVRQQLRRAERQDRRGAGAQWEANASLSQYLFRDESTYTYEEMFGPQTTTTESQVNQNELLTALDSDVAVTTNNFRARVRASGSYTNDFRPDGEDEGSVSALYLEIGDTDDNVSLRAGRQTRSSSGVFGRFDGAVASARVGRVRFDAIGGYPVESPRDLTFDPDRVFYAASAEYQGEDWDASIYRLRQTANDLVDRDAVGVELRYVSNRASLFLLADYDLHYKELNIGLANGSFTLVGDATLNLGVDIRKAPMLSTINALIGQPVASLEELRLTYTDAEVEQLARDRTGQATTYFAGLSVPINEKISFNVDATASSMDATPASGGVPATEETNGEMYASAQIVGTGLFKEGDLGSIGVRYANTKTSTRFGLDLNTRYPVSRSLRISPRLRLSHRSNRHDEGTQFSARPSLRLNYQLGRRASFEVEGGAEWQRNENALMREQSWDYFFSAGYRLDF